MTAYVFLGPSLPLDQARAILDAIYLPPVQQGDLLRLLELKPRYVGIIDGYFETVPAVWHKEILLAMSQGVHVFGAASMGALRAAELSGVELPARRPRFAHGAEVEAGRITIVCTFHPSQQNTFTGRLTPVMLDDVFNQAKQLLR